MSTSSVAGLMLETDISNNIFSSLSFVVVGFIVAMVDRSKSFASD